MIRVRPFLMKFSRPILSDAADTRAFESTDQNVKDNFQNRRLSTITTKVNRETTDDR